MLIKSIIYMTKKLLFFILLFSQFIFSQDNIPPEIFSEGNEVYCPLTEQNIVTDFNIIDPDDTTIDALYIQISEGYVQVEDSLYLLVLIQGFKKHGILVYRKTRVKRGWRCRSTLYRFNCCRV